MHNTPIKQTILALALACLAVSASAHRTWLLPTATVVENREPWVTVDAAISENLFDYDSNALSLDGVVVIGPDGAAMATPPVLAGKLRNSIDIKMAKDGTYKIALVTQNVMASYKAGGETKRFRGSEAAFAKEVPADAPELRVTHMNARLETFVTANKPSTAALKPTGVGLEMVPVTHPNDLRAGEVAKWRFTLDGKALPNFAFSMVPGGVRYRSVLGEIRVNTDANGEATVTLPDAGMYWLNASYPANARAGGMGGPGMGGPGGPGGAGAGGPGGAGAGGDAGPAVTTRYSYAATIEIMPQ